MSACPTEIGRPVVNQAAPALEKITARVSRLCGVAYRMGERGLDHLAGCACPFRGPIPEARPEPMRHGGDAEFFDQLAQRCVGARLPTRVGEHEAGAIAQSPRVVQDRQRPPRKRDAVIPLRLHARGGDGPDARVQIHFVPRRQAHFAGSRRRHHQELERPLCGDRGLGGSHRREGVRHRAVWQRPHVLDDGLLPSEGLPEGVARWVVRPVAHGDRPLHHGTDPLPHPPCGLGLVVPDRGEDCQDVGNALAARGYYDAFGAVKASLEKVLSGANAGAVSREDHAAWYRQLFGPSVSGGIINAADLAGYRSGPVYIRRSMHVPPPREAVRDCMPALFELLKAETEPSVRVVLGHFVFVYIHPYMDGNGRMGRFLMNVMLASGGYPWTIVPLERRDDYMAALESASVKQDIGPFAAFIGGLVEGGLQGKAAPAVPAPPESP